MPVVELSHNDLARLRAILATGPRQGVAVFNATAGDSDEAAQLNALLDSLRGAGLIESDVLQDDLGDTLITERSEPLSLGAPAADYLTGDEELMTEDGQRIAVI